MTDEIKRLIARQYIRLVPQRGSLFLLFSFYFLFLRPLNRDTGNRHVFQELVYAKQD